MVSTYRTLKSVFDTSTNTDVIIQIKVIFIVLKNTQISTFCSSIRLKPMTGKPF